MNIFKLFFLFRPQNSRLYEAQIYEYKHVSGSLCVRADSRNGRRHFFLTQGMCENIDSRI